MWIRKLKPDELEKFQARWAYAADSYPVPMEYLERVRVYGFFVGGDLLGGFTVCIRPPFRYIVQLPEDERQRWQQALDGGEPIARLNGGERIAELNFVWLDTAFRKSWRSYYFWLAVLHIVRRHGDVLLAGASEKRLAGLYEKALTLIVPRYKGPVTVDGNTQECEWVFMARRPGLDTAMKLIRLSGRLAARA